MRRADQRVLIIKLVFLAIFAVMCAAVWWYHLTVLAPRDACRARPGAVWIDKTRSCRVTPASACEAGGGWWEPISKTCARVIYVPSFTGKHP